MAQTGYTPIQLYRTTTAAAVPLTANLAPGELAINIANTDMALFAENASGTVTRIMNNPAGLKYPTADGTANQVLTTNGSGTLSFAAAAPTNGYRRNRIINGAMQVDQRNDGAAQTITTATTPYTVDRWIVAPTGASITGQRVAGPSGYQYAYQMSGAASVTKIDFQQRIESANTADLVNQNVILSANISNSLLTTVTWKAEYANAVDNFGAATLIATGTFTVSGTSTQYTATFNAGANAANGISINFSVGAQTSGTFVVAGVQLEAGSSATPFERQLISDTLAQCQRYYFTGLYAFSGGTVVAGGIGVGQGITFPTSMRVSPTITLTATNYVNTGAFSVAASSSSGLYLLALTSAAGGYLATATVAGNAEL